MTPRFETSDLPPRGIALALAGLFGGLLFLMACVAWFAFSTANHFVAGPPPGSVLVPAPRLLADPPTERLTLEAAQQRRITTQAKIPIDQAMQELARQGWGEGDPAPDVETTARAHVDAARLK